MPPAGFAAAAATKAAAPAAPKAAPSGQPPAGSVLPSGRGLGPRANKQVAKPGDWVCERQDCGMLVFAKRDKCPTCGEPRPPGSMLSQIELYDNMKPGDWICPKKDCGDLVFARRPVCKVCSEPRPPPDVIEKQYEKIIAMRQAKTQGGAETAASMLPGASR